MKLTDVTNIDTVKDIRCPNMSLSLIIRTVMPIKMIPVLTMRRIIAVVWYICRGDNGKRAFIIGFEEFRGKFE